MADQRVPLLVGESVAHDAGMFEAGAGCARLALSVRAT